MAKDQFEDEAEELVLEEAGGLHDHEEYHDDVNGEEEEEGEDHPVTRGGGRRRRKKGRRRAKNNRAGASTRKRRSCYNPCIACITFILALGFGGLGIFWTFGGGKSLGAEGGSGGTSSGGSASSGDQQHQQVPVAAPLDESSTPEQEAVEGLPPPLPPKPEEEETTTTTITTPPVVAPAEAEVETEASSPNTAPEEKNNNDDDKSVILGLNDVGGDSNNHEQAVAALVKNQQISNFKKGSGILVNFVITHHGGTTVRNEFRKSLKCPSFVCSNPTPADHVGSNYPPKIPWSYNDTNTNVDVVGQYFQFVMWQFNDPPHQQPFIADTNWENPNLVSMLVIREPLSRALAGDGAMAPKYPDIINHDRTRSASLERWWAFAQEPKHNNNYALRILSDEESCCDGNNTSRVYLEKAKELVKRFTFVLDINCLQHGLDKVAEILGFESAHMRQSMDKEHDHTPAQEKIPFPEVYEYLMDKNKLDIELYEYAKTLALLDCDAVYSAEAAEQQQQEPETNPP